MGGNDVSGWDGEIRQEDPNISNLQFSSGRQQGLYADQPDGSHSLEGRWKSLDTGCRHVFAAPLGYRDWKIRRNLPAISRAQPEYLRRNFRLAEQRVLH